MVRRNASFRKSTSAKSVTPAQVLVTLDAMTASRLMEFVAAILVDEYLCKEVCNEVPEIIADDDVSRLVEPAEVKDALQNLTNALDSAMFAQKVSATQHIRRKGA